MPTLPRFSFGRPCGWLSLCAGLALAGNLPAKDRADELAERLLQNPDFSDLSLSPDGSHLAMIYYREDQRVLGTYDLTKRKGHYNVMRGGQDVSEYGWLDNDRLIYSLSKWDYFHDGVYVVHEKINDGRQIDTEESRRLYGLAATLPTVRGQAILVNYLAKPFREFYRFEYPSTIKEIVGRKEHLMDFLFDRAGTLRVKQVGTDTPNQYAVYHRRTEDDPWEEIAIPHLSALHGFNYSEEMIYVTHCPEEHTVLQGYSLASRQFEGGFIGDPDYAVAPSLIRAPDTGDLMGFIYQADRPKVVYLDPDLGQVAQMLGKNLPGMEHAYVGQRGESGLLFFSWSDRQPGILHELNLKERSLKRVLETRPGIEGAEMAPQVPFTFPSRDGVTIRGYYTLPKGSDPAHPQPGPMIVIVHGGPRARDYWGFDPEVQFFAQLGYTVLQVNYRGSEDMYEDQPHITFLDACRFGVEDVVDGTRWMVAQGWADPRRLAIYGWSFGAYSAVACAEQYPDLFRCAYAAGGVYDFVAMWEEREERFRAYLQWDEDFLGDLGRDAEAYRAVSLLDKVDQVQIPIFLLHGDADGVVGASQSRALYRALKEAGKTVELETPAWLRHGPSNGTQRIRFTKAVYRFCEANLD